MPAYQPRHTVFNSEPADHSSRRRLILVRTGLGLALVGAALAISSVFVLGGGAHGGKPAAAGHGSSSSAGASAAHGATNGSGEGTSPATRAKRSHSSGDHPTGTGAKGGDTGTGAKGGAGKSTGGAQANGKPNGEGTQGGAEVRTTPTTNVASASTPAQALVTPAGFGPLLRSVWVAADPGGVGLTAADVRSTYPGSVYYAGQPSIAQYWSLSRFVPTAAAQAGSATPSGKALLAQFNTDAVFFKAPGRPWAYVGEFSPGSCPGNVPGTVLAAWGICTSVGS